MKKFDAAPVHLWRPGQRIQKLELRRASGRDDARSTVLLDSSPNRVRGVLASYPAQCLLIADDLYLQVRTLSLPLA